MKGVNGGGAHTARAEMEAELKASGEAYTVTVSPDGAAVLFTVPVPRDWTSDFGRVGAYTQAVYDVHGWLIAVGPEEGGERLLSGGG